MWIVDFSKVDSKLHRLPPFILTKLLRWAKMVTVAGMQKVRMIPGLHDEPLKGKRQGQRSIRLNRSWRAIYQESPNGEVTIIEIQDVTKHEY